MLKPVLLTLTVVLLAACGGSGPAEAPAPSATAAPLEADHSDVEAEYHQPPKPRSAGVGEAITLTGTNIGVRLRATVTGVERVKVRSKPYVAVDLRLENTGIAVHDDELRGATVSFGDGEREAPAKGVRAECSHGFDSVVRLDTGRKASGCLLFGASRAGLPRRFQLALELVPVADGGIWNLR
jgi:predicted small lipoprotein YifL